MGCSVKGWKIVRQEIGNDLFGGRKDEIPAGVLSDLEECSCFRTFEAVVAAWCSAID